MVPVDLGLRDRIYIVTGASAGLGFASAKALAAEGARLVISSRNEESITRAFRPDFFLAAAFAAAAALLAALVRRRILA